MKRKRKANPISIRFRYMNTSGSGEVQTQWMDEAEVLQWMNTNRQVVTGFDVAQVRLMKPEVIALVKLLTGEEVE